MLLGSRGGPLHCGITSPACGLLCLRNWRQHIEVLRSCEPSPLVALLPPHTSPATPGYSHVGFRGVRQGDAEVGNVLEDRIGRGRSSGTAARVSLHGQSGAGFAPCPQLPAGLCSPHKASPCMGMGPHSPWSEEQGKGRPATRGRGWETRGVWRAGNCFPSAFKAGL